MLTQIWYAILFIIIMIALAATSRTAGMAGAAPILIFAAIVYFWPEDKDPYAKW